jgi:hypothetical protein
MPTGTKTMHFMHPLELPAKQKATYLSICANYCHHKAKPECIQFTIRGDKINYKDKESTPTAKVTTFKLLINSIISTKDACFMTADIKDFYLKTPMNQFEYMNTGQRHPSHHHGTIQPPTPHSQWTHPG